MNDEMKIVKVSKKTWKELRYLKIEKAAQSLNEVIQSLLEQASIEERSSTVGGERCTED